jgi:hypothetical protein
MAAPSPHPIPLRALQHIEAALGALLLLQGRGYQGPGSWQSPVPNSCSAGPLRWCFWAEGAEGSPIAALRGSSGSGTSI